MVGSIRREFLLAARSRSEILVPIAFFLVVLTLYALAFGSRLDSETQSISIGVVWATALMSVLLATENLYRNDSANGCLDLFFMQRRSLVVAVLVRSLARWVLVCVPLCVLTPLAAWMLNVEATYWVILACTLLLGTPVLMLISILGSALATGIARSGVLLGVLVLPLYLPVMLLGTGVCHAAVQAVSYTTPLWWYLTLISGSLTALPFAVVAILRASQEY